MMLCEVSTFNLFSRERESGGKFIYANNCVYRFLKKRVADRRVYIELGVFVYRTFSQPSTALYAEHQKAGGHNTTLLRCLFGFMKIIVYEVEIWKIFFFLPHDAPTLGTTKISAQLGLREPQQLPCDIDLNDNKIKNKSTLLLQRYWQFVCDSKIKMLFLLANGTALRCTRVKCGLFLWTDRTVL